MPAILYSANAEIYGLLVAAGILLLAGLGRSSLHDCFRRGGGEFGTKTLFPLLVVILGPTGSGKTSLSVALGRRFNGEIVSCDPVAVYRGLEIGSAKPSAAQRKLVPHHLLDVVGPDAFYTAGDYSRVCA